MPSFLGKPLRSAVETAQQSGLEINAIGSGIAREQWPAPGSRLLAGQHITVPSGTAQQGCFLSITKGENWGAAVVPRSNV